MVKSAHLIGKTVVSEETGRKYGIVADFRFVAESGELLNIVIGEPTAHCHELNLERDENGNILIPFSCVKSIGDFVIISERELG